jgi:hypothetical protein
MTAIIAFDVVSLIPSAFGAREGHDVSIDACEGDSESKVSSSETHGVFVMLKV